ncbi:hypothetical protein BGX21_000695 [Mortierella sp. AD011]|nr:hypothetical protein BGX20_001259 [Mortierella sp. AD010]KAF9386886.1 hypothetical protein BGX21_000695 [Mortierella sp. AD011]
MSNVQSVNNEFFNKNAQNYDSFPHADEMTQRGSEVVVREFAASTSDERVKNASVLDFGCGTGLCAFKVATSVNHLLGVDASEGMLQYLNHKLSTNPENSAIRNKLATVNHLVTDEAPLPDPEFSQYLSGPEGGFDLVYSTYVMHHIEDVQGVVNTISKKLLKKDGWLIVVDFEGAHGHGHDHGHDHGHNHDHNHEGGEAHAHHHGHHHGHHEGQHTHEFFKGIDGEAAEYVAHKGGFTTEGFAEVFKEAGLVDVSATHSFGMNLTRNGKTVWTDFLVVKGRREA